MKEPGQLAWEAHEAHREWEDQTPWRILHPQNQAEWAAVESAIRADERAKVIEEHGRIADEYNAPDRFTVSDEWKAEMTPSEVYNIGVIDAAIWIAQAIRAKGAEHG